MLDTPLAGAAISLLLGLLLGLERERSRQPDERLFAGIRTFPILALCGYLGASSGEPYVLPAVLLAVSLLSVASYLRTAEPHFGATTEITALLAPLLGALVFWRQPALAAALAVVVTLLLTLKAPLHRIAGNVSGDEILAILKFGIVSVVLVPLLPQRPIGPWGAIVPRHLGLVVVVVSAVSLVGYLLVRLLGQERGWAVAGAVGGLVSSTAVALSFSQRARKEPGITRALATGIVLATAVLYLRALVLVLAFDPPLFTRLAWRLLALLVVGALLALPRLARGSAAGTPASTLGNPVEISNAMGLAALFGCILLGARAAQERFGAAGVQAAGLLGGLVDVDSATVALARLHQQGIASLEVASQSILLATLANLTVKGGIAVAVGGRGLARNVLPAFLTLATATAVALL